MSESLATLISQLDLDPQILKVMTQIRPFRDQWSPEVLTQSPKQIHQIRQITPQIRVITHDTQVTQVTQVYPCADSDQLWPRVRDMFRSPNQSQSASLPPWQRSILSQLPKLITNVEEFEYFMSVWPFYWQVLDALGDQASPNMIMVMNPITTRLTSNAFMFPSLQRWAVTHCDHITTKDLLVDQIPVHLEFIHQKSDLPQIPEITQKIGQILASLLTLYEIKPNANRGVDELGLNLTYIMTPFPKKLHNYAPNPRIDQWIINQLGQHPEIRYNTSHVDNPLSSLSVNSGLTSSLNGHGEYIIIWRQEEFYKVLIHELIHYYELEKGDVFRISRPSYLNVSNTYPPQSRELFTELQTWGFYTLWNLSQKLEFSELTTTNLAFVFNYERMYSLVNLQRIFHHNGLTSIGDLWGHDPHKVINANCSALYYYVLKAILLYDIDPHVLFPSADVTKNKPTAIALIKSQIQVNLSPSSVTDLDSYLRIIGDYVWPDTLRMMGIGT